MMYLKLRKFICLLLISTVMLMGCAAHTAQVKKPTDTAEKSTWLVYYKDQFKAYGKKVAPPSDDATAVQRLAYHEAKASWESGQNIGLIIGVVVLALGAGSLAVTLSQL